MVRKNIVETPVVEVVEEVVSVDNVLASDADTSLEERTGIFRRLGPKKLSVIILVLVAIVGVYGTFHYYNKYKALTVNANVEAQKETTRLVGLLGKLIELPTETPTVATISDKTKLVGQAFFAQAENGDVLFAFTTSMKAILYRPSTNKIINVAPISINPSQDLTPAAKKYPITSSTNKAQ